MPTTVRCAWAGDDPLYVDYHDREWGVAQRDSRALFELLILEGAQAGLSWITVLRKREGYRRAFAGFDPARVAAFGEADRERLLGDPGIVRNRAKIEAAIANAGAWLALEAREGGFAQFVWSFVDGRTVVNRRTRLSEIPASTPASERMSRELKRRGFRFVGPTICHAFMQAAGMVNDHVVDCFRHRELS